MKGTVVRFEDIDPHTIMTLEERRADGQVRYWAVEGPGRSQLERLDIANVPEVGDVIEFCAFPYKSPEELSRMFPGADFSRRSSPDADGLSREFVGGHLMATADGDMQLWNVHGMISECLRSSDDARQSWLEFLDSNARARRAWCDQARYTHIQSTAPLTELVDEINGLLENPCR